MSTSSVPGLHPRSLGWFGSAALAMGGSNQSLFLISALFAGQDAIPGQGSAAVPLLIVGLLLSWMAAPAWTELVLMWPNRVGGISAACAEAFRPYSPVLSAITGTCYWWGWVPTCGLTALLSASAIQQWLLPWIPIQVVACTIVVAFTAVNLCGIKWVARLAMPIATTSASLAFLSAIIPVVSGTVDWHQATDFKLTTPFPGWFGDLTSAMAGLYLIGFAAPAFEAATCHVGETVDPVRNIPRAVFASAVMAGVYFLVLPLVWLGALGPVSLGKELASVLGPTFAPWFGSFGKAAAIWFIILNRFHGTLQPLAGAARTLAQLSEDGLLPSFLSRRLATDCPWAATVMTALFSIVFLLIGDPIWMIAAANFTYLIAVCMPNVAAWLLRRDMPQLGRPYRAPKGTIGLGLAAAAVWLVSAILGFEQFGLPTVVFGILLAYSGAGLYALRLMEDNARLGLPVVANSLHLKLTGPMLLVLFLDSAGYLLAIGHVSEEKAPLIVALEDIFVLVALLSISVGLVLPGMITHSAQEISNAAKRLSLGTLKDFSRAMTALGRGDFNQKSAPVDIAPVSVHSRDELGEMAESFNALQCEVKEAARNLEEARDKMRIAQTQLVRKHRRIAHLAHHDSLTDLPNRNILSLKMNAALTRKGEDERVALLLLDLDNFKTVNDTLGHAAGDQLLVSVAARLREAVRETDTVVRLGGDEFAILIAGADLPLRAEEVSKRVISMVRRPISLFNKESVCGVSIGIALAPDDAIDAADLFRFADLALYSAKADGRGYQFFHKDLDERIQARSKLERELRYAIDNNQLEVHYQPVLCLDSGPGYVEALVRWRHPTCGLIEPSRFIPVAEETGMIVDIGKQVLQAACRDAASWPADVGVAVNVSALELVGSDLVQTIEDALAANALPANLLYIEITESAFMKDVDRCLQTLLAIDSLGIEVAMDDFGTGYSSLSLLRRFPFKRLKIDQSFVKDLEVSPEARAILATIQDLARILGMRTTAEGVETQEQLELVKKFGCSSVQGYVFHAPMPLNELRYVLYQMANSSETAA
ncbi:MAG: amino acid permease [Proteobacteria bacterium]|nr:amino acid permease [Pseudomonadota bacterium]